MTRTRTTRQSKTLIGLQGRGLCFCAMAQPTPQQCIAAMGQTSQPMDRPKGLNTLLASGALGLDMAEWPPSPQQGNRSIMGSPMSDQSPWSPCWSPTTPAVTTTRPACDMGTPHGMGAYFAPMTPPSGSAGPTYAGVTPPSAGPIGPLSPGAEIRQNAASLGIPLNLRAQHGEVAQPVPVRSTKGTVVAPSPTGRPLDPAAPRQLAGVVTGPIGPPVPAGWCSATTSAPPRCSATTNQAVAPLTPSVIRTLATPHASRAAKAYASGA